MASIVNKVYYINQIHFNTFGGGWRGTYIHGGLSNVVFLFAGRWAYNWGGLITGVLISDGLQYAFGHVSKDLSALHKLYV